ncbi:MAG: hypothetical protein ABFS24_14135 [Pseudomonadota bacterium]
MALLPKKLRFWLFDTLSVKTMRYLESVPRHKANGVVGEVYDQIADDFFVNGSLTSRSGVPDLFAAIWTGGRETVLVDDQLDRTTKEALTATLSSINDCPYCGDMMVSLVHAADQHDNAAKILNESEESITDPLLRERLLWVRSVATPGAAPPSSNPFNREQLPEVIGSLMALSDINRFSHIVMDGSPVNAPFGLQAVKAFALRLFGGELRATHKHTLEPGRTRHLLPAAELTEDMQWASPNPRIAGAVARWAAAVERESEKVIPKATRRIVHDSLKQWQGEQMPISRNWVEQEVDGLEGNERAIARLALVIAKASYQSDDGLVADVLEHNPEQEQFLRILAWSTFTAARYVAARIARLSDNAGPVLRQVA